jgi:hypothetical protein
VLIRVLLLLRKKRYRMVAPVTKGVEVMRSMVAIVIAVAVALPGD